MTALVLRPADPLDIPEARRLVAEVQRLPGAARVEVDVSAVREIHPAALGYLAYTLEGDARVALRGLNRRHERLLAYLLGRETVPGASATRTASSTTAPPAAEIAPP